MRDEKPDTVDDYTDWLLSARKCSTAYLNSTYYGNVRDKMKSDFEKSTFWEDLSQNLNEYNSQYNKKSGCDLFENGAAQYPKYVAELQVKSYDSLLEKSWRKNIINNAAWPGEPHGGWILPEHWYAKINDIVRTRFVVTYFDGVEFLVNWIMDACNKLKVKCDPSFESKEEGYYAAHIDIHQNFEILEPNFITTKIIPARIEIQIATRLQNCIGEVNHRAYELRRKKWERPKNGWQWQCNSNEFQINYIGHFLHYVDGILVNVRDR